MPKKKLYSRIESLFHSLNEEIPAQVDTPATLAERLVWEGASEPGKGRDSLPAGEPETRPAPSLDLPAAQPLPWRLREPPRTQPAGAGKHENTSLAVQFHLRESGSGHLEVIDERNPERIWNEDERLLAQEVADQLARALESARAYELAQQAVEEMREADRMKGQFLANMSHELRTPLNSIIGFSRVILKGIDGSINDTQQQDLTAIYNSGQHLLGLINDILDLSKIEAGKMELSFADVSIGEMIHSAMSTASGLVKGKPIQLVQITPDDLPPIQADAMRVRQVLINLLSNAAKFTEQGTITVEAKTVTGANGKTEMMILVTDTGPGIAAEDEKKLFQPFSQVDDSPTRKTGGTGLGLSICRSLIEMHGGQIGLLRSKVGEGSTFFFSLPMKQGEAAQEAGTETPTQAI